MLMYSPAVPQDLQLVIFDCDGVLVDSEVISNDVLAHSLTEQGLPTTLAQAEPTTKSCCWPRSTPWHAPSSAGRWRMAGLSGTSAIALPPSTGSCEQCRAPPRR